MYITFTRTGKCSYSTTAKRADGVTVSVPGYDRTAPLPHDLAHYVVEHGLGLEQGFWGCVAAGALFPGMKVTDGRQPPHAAERSKRVLREAGQRGTEAEVLVGALCEIALAGTDENWLAARARLATEWTPTRRARAPLTHEEVRRVCAALRAARDRF